MVKTPVKMKVQSVSNKVTPMSVDKPSSVHINNFIDSNNTSLVNRCRFLIIAETLLGINRLPLIKASKIWILLCHIYSVSLVLTWFYYSLTTSSGNTFSVIRYSNGFGLMITMFYAAFIQHEPLLSVTEKMYEIDKTLKITNETKRLNKSTLPKILLQISLTYCILECFLFNLYLEEESNPLFYLLYIALLAQDCEQMLFCMLVRSISRRLQIIKAHVIKTLSQEEPPDVLKKRAMKTVEYLVYKTELDVKSLLGLYESLHHCAQEINNLMGVPMTSMFFCSGLSTTLLLMSLIKLFQSTAEADINLKLICLYSIFRCVKYTCLVIFPCYYATELKDHVQVIRKVLHEAINISELHVLERRKLKTFLQMTRDNGFTYALCGVITLNMSMPLSYVSICTTYLVIIIQFSKFFD